MGDIIFIVDGGPQEGIGHIYESMTLAGERPPGTKVEFYVPIESEVIAEKLAGEGYSVMMVEPSAFIDSILDRDPDVIVFNLPNVNTGMVESIRNNLDARIVVYGDTETNVSPGISKHSDVIVSSNRVIEGFAGRRRRDPHGTLRLVGPKYQVLRPKFYEYANIYSTQTLRRIMLMFGGADPKNLTTYFVDKLGSLTKNYLIDAVIGAGFTNHEELRKAVAGERFVTVHEDINNVPLLMHRADLIITSPGLSCLEALHMGVPTLAIFQNAEQAKAYHEVWFAYRVEDTSDVRDLIEQTYDRFTERPMNHDIGTGKSEVLKLLYDR